MAGKNQATHERRQHETAKIGSGQYLGGGPDCCESFAEKVGYRHRNKFLFSVSFNAVALPKPMELLPSTIDVAILNFLSDSSVKPA